MIVGGVRTSDISDLDRICLMGILNQLNFGWVGYIRSMVGDMLLELDEARKIWLVRYIRLGQLPRLWNLMEAR
jgi:hypothetical protein